MNKENKPYSLESVFEKPEINSLEREDRIKVKWAYLDTLAAYEANIPYSHKKLPGIQGIMIYELNKRITAYSSALKEAERLSLKKNGI
jgi:hypothetical protein